MQNFSLTYAGAISSLIVALGILDSQDALALSNAVLLIVTTLVTLYGRWRKGDVSLIGIK